MQISRWYALLPLMYQVSFEPKSVTQSKSIIEPVSFFCMSSFLQHDHLLESSRRVGSSRTRDNG